MIAATQDRIACDADAAGEAVGGHSEVAHTEPGGLAGWVLGFVRQRNREAAKRHLKIVETLALGGRKQLLLVTCDGERFLVGSGADRVDSIVRVGAEKTAEEPWV